MFYKVLFLSAGMILCSSCENRVSQTGPIVPRAEAGAETATERPGSRGDIGRNGSIVPEVEEVFVPLQQVDEGFIVDRCEGDNVLQTFETNESGVQEEFQIQSDNSSVMISGNDNRVTITVRSPTPLMSVCVYVNGGGNEVHILVGNNINELYIGLNGSQDHFEVLLVPNGSVNTIFGAVNGESDIKVYSAKG